MSSLWSRIMRTSPAEFRDRLAQLGRAAVERMGHVPSGGVPDGALVPALPFPRPAPLDLATQAEVTAQADRIAGGRFDLLGHEGLAFGDPVDWHLDPVGGRRAPLLHWSRVPYLDEGIVGDHKVIWELNRHQFLVTLAQAWLQSGNPAYLAAFVRLVESWLDANPPKQGINWGSSLELAFRAIAWTWALHLLGEAVPAGLRERMARCLDLHGRHIEQHLSTWFSPNTHLTGEALGLLYLGTAWPGFRRAGRWQRRGWRILCEELERQVRPDGTYFEQSSWYQGYTVDFYLHALQLAEPAGLGVPKGFRERVAAAARVLAALARPDGTIPLIGDDDGGRLLPLGPRPPVRFTDTLARAASTLGDPSLAAAGGTIAFREGGWFIAREAAGQRLQAVIDAGPHGALTGAHAHADALSIDLSLGSVPLVSDPGSCRYVGADRDRFRSTGWHSTLVLPGEDSAESGGTFRWKSFPETSVGAWQTGPGYTWFDGWHDGWGRVVPGLRHHRSVLQLDGLGVLVLDRLAGVPRGQLPVAEIRWHCASGIAVSLHPPAAALQRDGETMARLTVGDGTPLRLDAAMSSTCYGSCRASVIVAATPDGTALERGCLTVIVTAPGVADLALDADHTRDCAGWRLRADGVEATLRRAGAGLEWSVLAGGRPGFPAALTLLSEAPR